MVPNKEKIISNFTKAIIGNKVTRNLVAKHFEKILYKQMIENDNSPYSKNARIDRFNGVKAMYLSVLKNLNKGVISKRAAKRLVETLVEQVFFQDKCRKSARISFKEKYGLYPPLFITLSPTKRCNLHCIGCYASSTVESAETLDWTTVDKIMTELYDEMGMRFFVISGGEPLMYKSGGKTILDLPKKWKDCFFLMYTNGTLITDSIAKEMAELGNITPAISVEGFEKETDARRGKGIHKQILKAMKNLRNNGVPFGISVTATKNNTDILLTDEFYNFYFDELGATYMWMFHYMPIGRKFTTELMVTPEQRFELFKKWKQILSEKEWFVADFWNSAILSNGCISCGKPGGYFYIDWNGNIMPCVFIPYYKHNVKQLFSKNKKIADALFSDFFVKGREWQSKYFNQNGKMGNLLRPCFIRDHHKTFLEIAKETNVMPQDEASKEAMEDKEYHNELIKFDEKLKEIEDPYWEKQYSKKQGANKRWQ